ncbi:MAG: dipeptide epimerase [Hydrotalea sp.]|nr:dipeptide epimerase [Hydrotalea sp.]
MLITKTEIYKFSIPMVPFTIATGTMHFAQNTLIRVHTSEGIIGIGECSAFPMIVGETQNTCFEMAKEFAGIWKGKLALEIDDRLHELDLFTAGNTTIKSAFDMALYDIAAKHANLPLYKFLGGSKKEIESDLTIGIGSPDEMAQQAIDFLQRKVRIIKIKLGKAPKDDIERIRKIREAVGPEIRLRIDANQGWSFDDAVFALTELGKYNIEFCEQPMRTYLDYKLPELCAVSPIPVMADESAYNHRQAERLIENKACHSINIKLAKSGGIREAIRIADLASQHHIPCMMGGMLESRVALTAKVHLAMSHENIHYYDLDTCLLGHLQDPVQGGVFYYNGMHLDFEDMPGIGVDVDSNYLQNLEQIVI